MTLSDAEVGQTVRIIAIPDNQSRVEAIRIGLTVGSLITIHQKLGKGPLVVRSAQTRIAIGRPLAAKVVVERVHSRELDS